MEEIWKDIDGYEGLYQVSNTGKVRKMPRELKLSTDANGYSVVQLKDHDGNLKVIKVHRLVAEAFLDGSHSTEDIVHHKDHNRKNNNVDNLSYMGLVEHTLLHVDDMKKGRYAS